MFALVGLLLLVLQAHLSGVVCPRCLVAIPGRIGGAPSSQEVGEGKDNDVVGPKATAAATRKS